MLDKFDVFGLIIGIIIMSLLTYVIYSGIQNIEYICESRQGFSALHGFCK